MARPLRIECSGAVYHVTSRGDARSKVFADDQDREGFLSVLDSVVKRYNWLCHAYCLMDNHCHLLIETLDANLSMGMRQLNGIYTCTPCLLLFCHFCDSMIHAKPGCARDAKQRFEPTSRTKGAEVCRGCASSLTYPQVFLGDSPGTRQ